jgi:glycosyltransferase involved in cell wall biosynthesis
MKVLLVNLGRGWGGGQEQLADLATELTEQGDTIHFLCRSGSFSVPRLNRLGFTVNEFNGTIAGVLRTARLIIAEQYDAVLATREHDLVKIALAWKLARLAGTSGRFVMAYHTATSRRQLFITVPDAIVCISNYVRNKLLKGNQIDAHRLHVIHNGIAEEQELSEVKFCRNRSRAIFKEADFPTIGMVGAYFKNQQELVAITPQLMTAFPNIRVILLGNRDEPTLLAPLQKQIRALSLEQTVIISEPVERARMNEVFADLDLSVSTFRNEGFGLVHLESLAAGTPVVAYDEGGQVDILENSGAGILVHDGMNEFAKAVIGLLHDDQQRYAMGRKGAELVRTQFSRATMAAAYRHILSGERAL